MNIRRLLLAISCESRDAEWQSRYNRGRIYLVKGESDKAIADYTEAIRLKADFAEAYYNRGVVYGSKDDFDKAIADFTEALWLKPGDARAHYFRGKAYCGKGAPDKKPNKILPRQKNLASNLIDLRNSR